MEKFRELRDAYLDMWSKNLIDAVNTEGYAQASGAALDGLLTVAAPFKEPAEQAMLKTLQQLNMPSSADFANLAGRFTNVEMVLDNLDAKLDRIEKAFTDLLSVARARAEASEPAKSAAEAAPVEPVAPGSAEAAESPEPAAAPKSARKTAQKKLTPLVNRRTPKRTANAKPVRRNARKGTR